MIEFINNRVLFVCHNTLEQPHLTLLVALKELSRLSEVAVRLCVYLVALFVEHNVFELLFEVAVFRLSVHWIPRAVLGIIWQDV